MSTMTHRERIEAALAFEQSDRLPYSMWMHAPNRDRHPRRLAELSLAMQKRYDLDFIKFMPFGLYSTIDYGLDLKVFPGFVDAPVAHEHYIKKIEDWDTIRPVSGVQGEYAVVLEAQKLLFSMMDERIPFLQTVFSPATTAAKLCSPDVLVQHIHQDPVRVHRALEKITATTVEFVKASIALGADGLFFASQMSASSLIDQSAFTSFVKKYDHQIFERSGGATWFNIFHIHGANALLRESQDYPVQAISWHDRDDGPSMDEVRIFSKKTFVGGMSWGEKWLTKTDEDVAAEIRDVAARHGGKGVILGPGCVIDPSTPESRLRVVYDTVLKTA